MARVSLLFSLTFALAVASTFAHKAPSSSASASFKASTVGELKTAPFVEIAKMIQKQSSLAPKTDALGLSFTVCKEYASFLSSFSKRGDFEFAFHGPSSLIWKVNFAAMKQALLAAQTGFKAGGKASLMLRKDYSGIVNGFAVIPAKIAEISARHQFKANAKLSVQEQKEFSAIFGAFKKSFTGYFGTASKIAGKSSVSFKGKFEGKIGGHISKKYLVNEGDFNAFLEKGKIGGHVGMKYLYNEEDFKKFMDQAGKIGNHVGMKYLVNEEDFKKFMDKAGKIGSDMGMNLSSRT